MRLDRSVERSRMFVSNPGSPLKEKFHGKILPSGQIELVSDGFEDWQAYIDSFKEETDIENILSRISAGEVDLLTARHGQYFDAVGMPSTYAEILQIVIDGQHTFERLPVEIKEKFGNDFNQWFAQMDNPDFMEKSGFVRRVEETIKEEGVSGES